MADAATITDSLAQYEAETLPQDIGARQRVQIQRAFMAGALDATLQISAGTMAADLLRQLADYGRVIGTAVERAN